MRKVELFPTRDCEAGYGPGGGGELNFFFFGGCVPRGFKNEVSRERIFLKKWGSWERKF